MSPSWCRRSFFFPSNNGKESSAAAVLECAIVPSEKTDTRPGNGLRMLMRHRAVRKDRHVGMQRINTNYRCWYAKCRQKRQTRWHATNYGCWKDKRERRHCNACVRRRKQASRSASNQKNRGFFMLHRHNRPSDATATVKLGTSSLY